MIRKNTPRPHRPFPLVFGNTGIGIIGNSGSHRCATVNRSDGIAVSNGVVAFCVARDNDQNGLRHTAEQTAAWISTRPAPPARATNRRHEYFRDISKPNPRPFAKSSKTPAHAIQ